MRLATFLFVTIVLMGGHAAVAHGEDVPGPHGGEIRMPGAYHTEVILLARNRLRIFLLDMSWKNPTIQNSEVGAVVRGKTDSRAVCEKEDNTFVCTFGDDVNLSKKGSFEIQSTRDGVKGATAKYKTPLKFGAK